MIKGITWIGGRLAVNVLATTSENAAAVVRAAGHSVLVGMVMKGLTREEGIRRVTACHEHGVPVSVGLGAGDPTIWRLAAEVAAATQAAHVNQVFPTAAFTHSMVSGGGTVANALIAPTGTPGKVIISTGPTSKAAPPAVVDAATAAAMLADAGVPSVKFFPVNEAWDELAAMAKAAAAAGIPLMEPTGGLTAENVAKAASICLDAGCAHVVPHVYSAVVDKQTGLTRPEMVVELVEILSRLVH